MNRKRRNLMLYSRNFRPVNLFDELRKKAEIKEAKAKIISEKNDRIDYKPVTLKELVPLFATKK